MRNLAMVLLACAVAAAAAQNAPAPAAQGGAPPPDVEAALRDRATRFFQAQVDGKYRQAEQYVAEDTKDYFYTMTKTPVTKFQIGKISYSDRFTKAKVTVEIEREISAPMIAKTNLSSEETSDWKIDGGLWSWTADQTVVHTPFGDFERPAPLQGGAKPAPIPFSLPKTGDENNTVAADRSEVTLGPHESAQVVLRNSLPGPVALTLDAPKIAGLEMKLDPPQVGANGRARVLFSYQPAAGSARQEVVVKIVVLPTNQEIPIHVTLAPSAPSGK
jgi:hypothetical protein